MSDSLEIVQDGPIATLRICRPQVRNALDLEVIAAMEAALDRLESDGQTRVIVLTGAGDRVFCAGADLAAAAFSPEGRREAVRRYAGLLVRIWGGERPVIARVGGHCVGGGVGLLLACDLAVMGTHAAISLPEGTVGMWPMMVGALLLRDLPRKRAMELALTGRRLTAEESVGWGLVNRAVAPQDLDGAVAQLAAEVLKMSPSALRHGRKAWRELAGLPVPEAMPQLADRLAALMETEDAAEGFSAFLERRAPEWKDR